MNEVQIVALISLAGFLIMSIAGLRGRDIKARKLVWMAGAWAGIFAIVILFISLATRS